MLEKQNDAQTMLDAGNALAEPMQALNGTPYTVVPDGYTVQSLEHLLQQPSHIKHQAILHDQASFIAYIQKFREPTTAIFFNQPKGSFRAVLDYHGGPDMGEPNPQWCAHTALFAPRGTPEWLVWCRANGQKFSQTDFAAFLEAHIKDIQNGDVFVKIPLNMQYTREVKFTSVKRLNDAGVELLTYEDVVKGTSGKLDLPPTFTLYIRPYIGGEMYFIECRLRLTLNGDNKLSLWFEISNQEKVLEVALGAIREAVEEETGITAFAGE